MFCFSKNLLNFLLSVFMYSLIVIQDLLVLGCLIMFYTFNNRLGLIIVFCPVKSRVLMAPGCLTDESSSAIKGQIAHFEQNTPLLQLYPNQLNHSILYSIFNLIPQFQSYSQYSFTMKLFAFNFMNMNPPS